MDYAIAVHVREGCGIRSIARLLKISPNTVMRRIRIIAASIQKPAIVMGRRYEVDELKTYVKNKRNECWVIYAIDKETKQVVDLKVGRRNQKNIKKVTDTLLLSGTGRICTDGLGIYRAVIPEDVHSVRPYGTNQIESMNLSLRTHLKRLNRRTICYTKRIFMLEACLAIYFWYSG